METKVDPKKLREVCRKSGIEFLGIFGSRARGTQRENSDVDLLVRFADPNIGLLEHLRIEDNLAEVFGGRKVDLVSERALHPYLRPYVSRDLKVLYERR